MVNYMVAVDSSENSKIAFWTAVQMAQSSAAHLYILNVVEEPQAAGPFVYSSKLEDSLIEDAKQASRELLLSLGKVAKELKVDYTALSVICTHNGVPQTIVQQAAAKCVDFIVLGKRDISKIRQLLLGSVSSNVIEHANCNVVIAKGSVGPEEEHVDKRLVIQAEEAERERRVMEFPNEYLVDHFQSDLDLNIVRLAEEKERMDRVGQKDNLEAERKAREAAHMEAVLEEEKERQRRMQEEAIIDDRKHKLRIFEPPVLTTH